MMPARALVLLLLLVSCRTPSQGLHGAVEAQRGPVVALVGATTLDPTTSSVGPDSVVLLRAGHLERIGPAATTPVPAGAEVIDVHGKWVLPGFVDAHVHFFQSGSLYTRPDGIDLRSVRPYATERALLRAGLDDTFRRWLASGVTSVVDVGGPLWNFEVRERAAKTDLAPRVAVAGPLLSSISAEALELDDPPIVKISTPEQAIAQVRAQAAHKADLIKLWYVVPDGGSYETFRPLARAAIDESHRLGLRVAVHATQLETARAAVQDGADILVHLVDDRRVDDHFVGLLRDRGVIVITTLGTEQRVLRVIAQQLDLRSGELAAGNPEVVSTLFDLRAMSPATFPENVAYFNAMSKPEFEALLTRRLATAAANLARLQAAGVVVALGTDAGNPGVLPGPSYFREVEFMRAAGLTPWQVLRAATESGAHVFMQHPTFGTLAPGSLADLVVLDADPLVDLSNTERVYAVVKDGRFTLSASLVDHSPAAVVQRQLNAYNARAIEPFLATYAPKVVIVDPPAAQRTASHADLRAEYEAFFAKVPRLHCEIKKRTVEGNTVTDAERVTGFPDGTTLEATATYTVEAGLITAVTFGPATITPPR